LSCQFQLSVINFFHLLSTLLTSNL
jgi:hypothetical protein